ncbi:MAG: FlgD immunoglobulin-like domain containing protein [Candidatus Eisenbacteria bacterium]
MLVSVCPSAASIEGLQMIGIGLDPDVLMDGPDPPVPPPEKLHCTWTQHSTVEPYFAQWPVFPDPQCNDDVDLLWSDSFNPEDETLLTGPEIALLLTILDQDADNTLGVIERDLQLAVNYLSATGVYDNGFEVFPDCADSIPLSQRDHVDIYLCKYGKPAAQCTTPCASDPNLQCGDATAGSYMSGFYHYNEDRPFIDHPDSLEYSRNAFRITDSRGNCGSDTEVWPTKAAQGAIHELGHALWASSRGALGAVYGEDLFNELFAGVAGYITKPGLGSLAWDKPYGQSLLKMRKHDGCGFNWYKTEPEYCPDPENPDPAGWEDCRTGYTTWGLWTAYLSERFRETSYQDDLLYRWAHRQESGSDKLARDMCGLAEVLEHGDYAPLGETGGERLNQLFSDFSVAKWIDAVVDITNEDYWFQDAVHPVSSFGLFQKNDYGVGVWNCWELAVPPQFTVADESDGAWRRVPGNASQDVPGCANGWNDPTNDAYCDNAYCDTVVVRLWGSDYIAFKADTGYYDASKDDRFFRFRMTWDEGAMYPGTELWVSIIEYTNVNGDPLYKQGGAVSNVRTSQYGAADLGFAKDVFDFHEGGVEAVAVVLSLVQTDYARVEQDCSLPPPEPIPAFVACMSRIDESPKDLKYSYSFSVFEEVHSGGCPFVEVAVGDGFASDNNVLVGGTLGSDVVDFYHLEREPELDDGAYTIRLSEDYTERSHFDRVALLVADHEPGTEIDVSVGGHIQTYRVASKPVECTTAAGVDVLGLLAEVDGDMYTMEPTDVVEAVFRADVTRGGGAGAGGEPSSKVPPPDGGRGGDDPSGAVDLSRLCYRANRSTAVLPLPVDVNSVDGLVRVRYTAPTTLHLDDVFLAEFIGEPLVQEECQLLSAEHSVSGGASDALSLDDGQRIDLSPGEAMELRFRAPRLADGLERDFVLVTEGHYETVGHRPASESEEDSPHDSRVSALYPNPFTSSTRVRFEVPSPGGWTSVRVHDLAGRLVRELGGEELAPGAYELEWDGRDSRGSDVAAGVYFYQISAPGLREQRKVIFLK